MCTLCPLRWGTLADAAYQPLSAFLHDLVGANGEVEFLVLIVISGNDLAVAEDEGSIAVVSGLLAGEPIEPRSDRLEGVKFEQRVIFPFSAGER